MSPRLFHRRQSVALATGAFLAAAVLAAVVLAAVPAPQPDQAGPHDHALPEPSQGPRPRLPEGMAGPLTPVEAAASMEVIAGLRLELVAAEPLVADPVAIDWGVDGSVWVAEMADYPLGIDAPPGANQTGRPGGRIRRLTDADGDGILDTSVVFLDEIAFPAGVMAWRDGVLVAAAPLLVFARDTNGDGRADERITLYEGFKEGNQQHRVNGPRWGIDGWCHLANGDSGGRVRSALSGRELDLGNRDLKVRPDTGGMELVAGMSQFGRAAGDWGHWFGCTNSTPAFQLGPDDSALARNRFVAPPPARHPLLDAAQQLHPLSPTVARFNYPGSADHFTSACGVEIYRDGLLAAGLAGNVVVCEPAHNLVHREAIDRSGWKFSARPVDAGTHLLRSRDNWCRPVQVRTGPDGGLWIIDMYRAVIEHPEWIPTDVQERIDLRAGDDRGRIWRLAPADGTLRAVPRIDRLAPAELVRLLDAANGTLRDMAQRLVIERCTPASGTGGDTAPPDAATVADYRSLLRNAVASADRPIGRATALRTLQVIGGIDEPLLRLALDDADPRVQAHAVAVSRDHVTAWPDLAARCSALATTPAAAHPDLALELAYALGGLGQAAGGDALAALLVAHHEDPIVQKAVFAALDPALAAAVLAALVPLDPSAAPLPAAALPVAHRAELTTPLVRIAVGAGADAAVAEALAPVCTADGQGRFAAWQFQCVAETATAARSRGTTLAGLLGAAVPAAGTPATLTDVWRLVAAARTTAVDPAADQADARAAIRLLGQLDDADRADPAAADRTLLAALLGATQPPAVQLAALDALARVPRAAEADVLIDAWKSAGSTLARGIIDRLLGHEPWALATLEAIAAGRLPASALDAAARQRLAGHSAAAVRARAAEVGATASSSRSEVLARYATATTLAGDADRGVTVFATRCGACHRMGTVGHEVGPNLAAVGNRSPQALLEAILDPNRVVEDRYVSYIAVTTDGRQHTGILVGETDTAITLRGQDGRDTTLLREALDEVVRTGRSLMPEGLENDLSIEDVADLCAAIGRLGAGPPAAGRETH